MVVTQDADGSVLDFEWTSLGRTLLWVVDLDSGVLKVEFERECPLKCDFKVHRVGMFGKFCASQ